MSESAQDRARALIKEINQDFFNDYTPRLEALEKAQAKNEGAAELRATIEKMDERFSDLQAQLDKANAEAVASSFTRGSDKADRLEKDATAIYAKQVLNQRLTDTEEVTINNYYQKTWNVSSSTAAGNLVPESFATEIMKQVELEVPFFQLADLRDTDRAGSTWLVQTSKGTAGVGTEVATSANTAEGAIAEVTISLVDIDAEPSVTRTLLEDSAFDVLAFIRENASEAIADKFGDIVVNGQGAYNGLIDELAANSGVASAYDNIAVVDALDVAGNTYFDMDDIIELKYAVPSRYRRQGRCSFVAGDEAIKLMRKLKDNNGQYLWQPSAVEGAPNRFDGDAVYESPYMPASASGAAALFYGDFKKGLGIVNHVGGMVSVIDPYTNKKLIKHFMKHRMGAGIVDGRALRALLYK